MKNVKFLLFLLIAACAVSAFKCGKSGKTTIPKGTKICLMLTK